MAEDFIEEIYLRAIAIPKIKKEIFSCRSLNKTKIYEQWKQIADILTQICRETTALDVTLGH